MSVSEQAARFPVPLLVFTDLDGTLLDHDTYDHAPAYPALNELKAFGAGVVLASSKTAAEIAPLRAELGLDDWPAIVENGGGILAPGQSATGDTGIYSEICTSIGELPDELKSAFRGFADMTVDEVSAATGLRAADAKDAKARQFTEPGLWTGTNTLRERFSAHLSEIGLTARMGGRFLTVSRGHTKAGQMQQIIADIKPAHSVALGDAPNDIEMLETADFGFIVANPHGQPLPPLTGEATGRIRRTELPGPSGWNAAMLSLLSELKFIKESQADG